ncbi:DEKNAAC101027 [Brettanomyces naardenensis]|uniref:DEKNAAC101027 n=1 Tax=Brettanomyces naardenensis TaxID=13370 RepID=A0A448YH44_BRENA|nr:DEKNAAC101027 [Brettanomyces naardenensis]
MTALSAKLHAIFSLKKRTTLLVKSSMINAGKFESIDSDSDASRLTEKELLLDKFEITDAYTEGYVSLLDRAIIVVVRIAGSVYMFFAMWLVLILWIVLGIIYKAPSTWQILMQDGQSIQTYAWDTLLMRQQLDDSDSFLKLYGRLKSRYITHRRLFNMIMEKKNRRKSAGEKAGQADSGVAERTLVTDLAVASPSCVDIALPPENWFDRLCSFFSRCLGSLPSVLIYWMGIFIWIACGNLYSPTGNEAPFTGRTTGSNPEYSKWNNTWQMYINTAIAVELLITSVLLENVRNRNDRYVRKQMQKLSVLDCKIEGMSRYVTGDMEDNEVVEIPPVKRTGLKRVISIYADVIGTGIGLVISLCVFAVWLAIGPTMKWNSNWWLIIGTYTGLVGFIDGFTLREVYYSITHYEEERFMELLTDSQELLDIAGINYTLRKPVEQRTISYKMSAFMNRICSNQWSVVASLVAVVLVICIASGMRWSLTGQLICNTPTMIIEGFCLLILIQAHNWADYKRRFIVKELAISREVLYERLGELIG